MSARVGTSDDGDKMDSAQGRPLDCELDLGVGTAPNLLCKYIEHGKHTVAVDLEQLLR